MRPKGWASKSFPDLRAEPLPPLLRAIQLGRDLGDHPTHRDRAGYDHGLGVEGPGDGLGERGREARRALPERPRDAAATRRGQRLRCRVAGEQVPCPRIVEFGAQYALQGRWKDW